MTGPFLLLFRSPDGTGSMKMMNSYATALRNAGREVIVMHGDRVRGGSEDLPAAGVQLLTELADHGVTLIETSAFRAGRRALFQLVCETIRSEGVSAVFGFHQADRAIAVAAARRTAIRSILCVQNLHTFHGPSVVAGLKEAVFARAVRRADLLIASSATVAGELQDRFRATAEDVVVIPNAIDVSGFPPPSPEARRKFRTEHSVAADQLVLLNVGRIDPQKGHDVLFDALEVADLQNVRVFVAGGSSSGSVDDEYPNRIAERVKSSAALASVEMLGWRDDVRDLLEACDLYVHPSIWEGWPLAVIEAMAASKPIVLSDCVGRPSGFIDGVHGHVVPVGDAPALAAALHEMVSLDGDMLAAAGSRSRALALEHYDLVQASRSFLTAIDRICY